MGEIVETTDGLSLETDVGSHVGSREGFLLIGVFVGLTLGELDGSTVGMVEGVTVGGGVAVGDAEGLDVTA